MNKNLGKKDLKDRIDKCLKVQETYREIRTPPYKIKWIQIRNNFVLLRKVQKNNINSDYLFKVREIWISILILLKLLVQEYKQVINIFRIMENRTNKIVKRI